VNHHRGFTGPSWTPPRSAGGRARPGRLGQPYHAPAGPGPARALADPGRLSARLGRAVGRHRPRSDRQPEAVRVASWRWSAPPQS